MSREIAEEIERTLLDLTREEKLSLTAGSDMWHTTPVDRLGLPAMKLSDGPNGVRGETRDTHPVTSASFPVGTALASTWNPDLIFEIGKALAQEAKSKGVHILLGPTVNMHRGPLAGRNFECFSEDPFLASRMTVAYIQGVQSEGIAACVKHFICNDQETERFSISAEVSRRALQEIYLPPFKAAVQEAGVYTVMAAYNRLNGTYASENQSLLQDILKGMWAFDGLVISDWYGTYSEKAASSGCDLEMPGPARWMGKRVQADPDQEILDDQIRRFLRTMIRTNAAATQSEHEQSNDRPEHRKLIREAGADGIVLLKNLQNILPLDSTKNQKIAVIGLLADQVSFQGGGSSQVAPHYVIQPLEAIREQCQGEVAYAQGYEVRKQPPALDQSWLVGGDNHSGQATVDYFDNSDLAGEPVHQAVSQQTSLSWFGETAQHWNPKQFSLRMQGTFRPPESRKYTFTLSLIGRGRLLIDEEIMLDLWENLAGEKQKTISLDLDRNKDYAFTIEYACGLDLRWRMVQLGAFPAEVPDLFQEAVDLAATADLCVVVAGLTPEWESEGFDREDLSLPDLQDKLIQEISGVNPNTIVVLNTGSPVLMPWLGSVPAVLQSWYLGQESGNAIADVLFGKTDPGGRLPTSFPADIKDAPAMENFPGTEGQVRYREGIFIGYRHYENKGIKPLFPFGHGLSYTEFKYQNLQLNGEQFSSGSLIKVTIEVTNTGRRAGTEVVQLYLEDLESALPRPPKELKGFKKIQLQPGETAKIGFILSESDLVYYDDTQGDWVVEPGDFKVKIGRSSADIILERKFKWV